MKIAGIDKNDTPLIETGRLILRKFTPNDIDNIVRIYGDEDVNTFLPWFPITTVEAATEYLYTKIFPCYAQDLAYTYAIALKSDNHAIGYVHINSIGDSNDIGYGLRKEFWHKGITTEACTAVCDRFRDAGHAYITATHDVNNPNSGAVMKKLGMTYRYSFEELWQPKNILVIFRMYQRDFSDIAHTYNGYQKKHGYFIESIRGV